MMHNWTSRQLDAIHARNRSILVSAAAGSGKTAVLIERIMTLLREGQDIRQMLVVTFTRAAAIEMRDRLLKVLLPEAAENPALKIQRDRLGSADISTLHQFCIKLIRQHFQAVGADPQSRVGDDGILKSLLERALKDEMEAMYENPDEDALCLIEQFTDMQIEDLFSKLYTFLMAQEKPWEWLNDQVKAPQPEDLVNAPWYGTLLLEALLEAGSAVSLANTCILMANLPGGPARYLPAAQSDLEIALAVQERLKAQGSLPPDWKAKFTRLSTAKAGEDESEELKVRFKALREAAKGCLERAMGSIPRDEKERHKAALDIALTLPALRALAVLTLNTHLHFGKLKRDRQLWDYADLEHQALACLADPAVLFLAHRQYEAIFVDEYQDISRIQEAIIRRLQGEKASLFMVGDVKQSIYRFRLADPMLFLDKYTTFDESPDSARRVITLSENFRSRDNILLSVNHVFDHALAGGTLEINYDSEAALYPGHHSLDDPPSELHLILPRDAEDDEDGEQPGGCEREAQLMARRITELRGSIVQGTEGPRALSFRDMVILLRSASGRAQRIAEVLRDYGIPVYSDADSQFFDLIEVTDFLNLLHILDNPYDDQRLMAVLSAPPFQFTPDDLIRVRVSADQTQAFHKSFFAMEEGDRQVNAAIKKMAHWRLLSQNLPLEGFVRRLLRETGIYARAGVKPQGELRRANLRLLCERASPNPQPQTLHGFLGRVTQARKQDNTRAAATLGAGEDVVRIMTIHKSKGLEFPVVFLPDLAHRFRLGSQGELLLMDAQGGAALKRVDQEARLTYHTLAGKAIQMKKDRQIRSEEARLLYVAMTRAKERLILLSAPANLSTEQKRWAMAGSGAGPGKATNMLEWIGGSLWPALESGEDSLYTAPNLSRWQILYHQSGSLLSIKQKEQAAIPLPCTLIPGPLIREMLAPLALKESLPLKLSVTQLTNLQAEAEEETPRLKRQRYEGGKDLTQTPTDGSAVPGILRGIATHKALGSLSLQALRSKETEAMEIAVKEEIESLVLEGRLEQAQASAIDISHITAFYQSCIGCRLLSSVRVQREWAFSLVAEGGMIVQGVIDCCFMEGDAWVLIDYKTDIAPPQVIESRYRDQLRWYMRALVDITGIPVKEAYLYALTWGVWIPILNSQPISYQKPEVQL